MGREQRGSRKVYAITDAGAQWLASDVQGKSSEKWRWSNKVEEAHVFTDRAYAVTVAFEQRGYIVELTTTERGN